MSHNLLSELPANLFERVNDLRVVDLSHNRLKFLPDKLFPDDGLESSVFSYKKLFNNVIFNIYRADWTFHII